MLNMSSSSIIGNRNSTPDSSLRPPSARTFGAGHQFRASADMSNYNASSPQLARARPASELYGQHNLGQGLSSPDDTPETQAQQWINDINQNEQTLEEMAAATLDADFKGELSAIEQWFKVLSEAERTASLYALLQQTTPVQIRFFSGLLKQMGKNHPMAGTPATFEKDPMQAQFANAMNKLSIDSTKVSGTRNPAPGKRLSGLDPNQISLMFPDAAAAIATEKAKYNQQTGNTALSNRNSTAFDNIRSSLIAPTITTSSDIEGDGPVPSSPWITKSIDISRPKSASGLPAMGQFQQPPLSAGLRSPRANIPGALNLQNSNLASMEGKSSEFPLLSPYAASGNWASMVNTPMAANFTTAGTSTTDMSQMNMKLAALSTVNNRFALDNNRNRRARSTDPNGNNIQGPMSPGIPNSIFMVNDRGQVLSSDQIIALQTLQLQQQQQQQAQMGMFNVNRSRPNSPGLAMQGSFNQQMNFASPQNNGFLTSFNASSPRTNHGMGQIGQMSGLNPGSFGHDGFGSEDRGRSPRGRRGSSKPPEDPTDITLLQDIPSWLRTLRLHKYTDNLKNMKWNELIELDEAALEAKGVAAVGARRKMLKVFEEVKKAKADGKL